jgi:hypothetical protein
VRRAYEHEHGRANLSGDAAVLVSAIETQHPEPFRAVDRDELLREAARVDALDSDVPGVVAVELMRIIALLGARNGHTAIHPLGEHPSTLQAFPLWLYEFDDGVFVVDAERSDLVGTELIAVEGVDVDDVLAAVTPLIAYDNEWTIRARRPTFVVHASVLSGLGLINESAPATFRLRARNGAVVNATLDAVATGDVLARVGGDRELGRPGPAYLRRRRDWHWTEVAADGRAVHVGYDITRGDVTNFALEVETLAGSSRVAVVILDLRQNGGGDNRTYKRLLESLERLGSEKRLAVLTSRFTFSAAMQLIVELEQKTQAVFVGEPTGGSPNHYGNATRVELPTSGLNAFVATVAWKTAGEFDDRVTRMPDIPVRQNSTAFFAGNDPVLDAAVAALA